MQSSERANTDYWNRISTISFLLAIMVVIRHNSAFANYDIANLPNIHLFLKNTITEISVPMFFMISGFNYFLVYDLSSQKEKIKRRVKSLLVPYFAWNTIYCAFSIITTYSFISKFFIGREKFELSAWNIISSCLYHGGCNNHFWFVFELMIISLICPIIYFLLRKRFAGVLVLASTFIIICVLGFQLPTYIFYRTDVLLYYMLGAYLSLNFPDIVLSHRFKKTRCTVLIGVLLICCSFFLNDTRLQDLSYASAIQFFIICAGIIGVWILSEYFKDKGHSPFWTGGTVFFIYAAHGIIQPVIVKLLYLVMPENYVFCCINFFVSLLMTVSICIMCRLILKKLAAGVDYVLVGWRK